MMKKILKKSIKASIFGLIMACAFVVSYVFASIPLGSNFQLNSQLPLDARTVVVDLTSRDAIPAGQRYQGLNVYVISNATNYQLQNGITNSDWAVLGGGATAANISGGLGGQILYQSAVNTTAKLANGTAGDVLTSRGTTLSPIWTTLAITAVNTSNLFSTGLGSTGVGVTTTDSSIFLGPAAGFAATSASYSNFFGYQAGNAATTAGNSNFLGALAGDSATNAHDSNFFGENSGRNASSATNSNFFGSSTGMGATSASDSNFFGTTAGNAATSASNSNFFGNTAGSGASSAADSNFFGHLSGTSAINASNSNFMGYSSGANAPNASNSIFIGQKSGFGDTVNNTTDPDDWSILLGYNTLTGGFKNSILLGGASSGTAISNTKANQFMLAPTITELLWRGIDYTLPSSQGGANTVLTNNGSGVLSWIAGPSLAVINTSNLFSTALAGTGSGVTTTVNSNFFGVNAGSSATGASFSNFFGVDAGNTATNAIFSNFLGQNAGNGATNANRSNFIGNFAGNLATDAFQSNFIGTSSGRSAANASNSNFFGPSAGWSATLAANSNFMGFQAGKDATNTYNSNFFGESAGESAIDAANSTFIGRYAGMNDTVVNTAAYDDLTTFANTSILIGHKTSTGGNKNSIALGAYATNTAANQLMLGSANRPINTTVWNGAGSVTCTFTTAVGAMTCASDINLKKNILTLDSESFELRMDIDVLSDSTLNKILALTPVTYNWNYESDNDDTHMGFIAQEVEQVFPNLVTTNQITTLKSLNITGLTPYIVKAIQEMNLNMSDINNMEKENTWRDSITAWLGNAKNGISSIHTKELCVEKSDGTDFCANGDLLEAMVQHSNVSTSSGSSSSGTLNPSLPIITINGENNITLVVGDSYVDEGATALSDVDGDITANINIVNNVDTSTAGSYVITYNVKDVAGNSALEVTRTVIVNGQTPAPAV